MDLQQGQDAPQAVKRRGCTKSGKICKRRSACASPAGRDFLARAQRVEVAIMPASKDSVDGLLEGTAAVHARLLSRVVKACISLKQQEREKRRAKQESTFALLEQAGEERRHLTGRAGRQRLAGL